MGQQEQTSSTPVRSQNSHMFNHPPARQTVMRPPQQTHHNNYWQQISHIQNQSHNLHYQQMNQLYRQQLHGQNEPEQDLKSFQLQSYVNSDSLKVQITEENLIILQESLLQLNFKVDTKVSCNVRISCCVTEQRNDNNMPSMFYTPNKDDYVQEINMKSGFKQEVSFGQINFKYKALQGQELTKNTDDYWPLVISINYQEGQKYYAFIDYCVFGKDSSNKVSSVRSLKQIIIMNGLPFQIKNIYGLSTPSSLESENNVVTGEAEQSKECTICLSEETNVICMPCGHMCMCKDCGQQVKFSNKNQCPVCRTPIQNLVPMKK